MLFIFFIGFFFGVFVAQESTHFPSVKENVIFGVMYLKDMVQGADVR